MRSLPNRSIAVKAIPGQIINAEPNHSTAAAVIAAPPANAVPAESRSFFILIVPSDENWELEIEH
jgi:hypothetical protein